MNIHDAERVLVVSDPHGHPKLIRNALDHAGFDAVRDGLICAGDLVDGDLGPDEAREEMELLKAYDAQVLWGNHDVAVLLDYHISYQREWSRPTFRNAFREDMGPERVLPGVTQVAGHSAPEMYGGRWTRDDLAAAGLHIVDACYHDRKGTDRFRYAVIENGKVGIRER